MDVIEYAKSLKDSSIKKLLRLATVHSLGSGVGKINIVLADDIDPVAARALGSYQPEVGDVVTVLVDGSDMLVLGSVQKQIEVDSRDFLENPIQSDEIADLAVNNAKIALNAINTDNIVNGAVARVKIAEAAINESLIEAGAVTETKIADDSISTPKLQADSITSTKIQSGAIETFHLTAGAVTADKIASRTITADRIGTNVITATEIAAGTLTSASGVFGVISADDITTGTLNANDVTITNLSVTNAMISSVSASKITAGTISASISINAPTITGGTATFGTNNVRLSDARGIEIISGTDNWNELSFVNSFGGTVQLRLGTYPSLGFSTISSPVGNLRIISNVGSSTDGVVEIGNDAGFPSNNLVVHGDITNYGNLIAQGNITATNNLSVFNTAFVSGNFTGGAWVTGNVLSSTTNITAGLDITAGRDVIAQADAKLLNCVVGDIGSGSGWGRTSNPTAGSTRLVVTNVDTDQPTASAFIKSRCTGTDGGMASLATRANSTVTRRHWWIQNPNGTVGSVSTSASSTSYNTSSDTRLKKDTYTLKNGRHLIKRIRPVEFNWAIDNQHEYGFLAHEIQRVVPWAVTGWPEEVDRDGNIVPQQLDATKILPILVAAVREINREVERLTEALDGTAS